MNHCCWKPKHCKTNKGLSEQNRWTTQLWNEAKSGIKIWQTHQRHFFFSAHISSHFQAKYIHGSAVIGHTTPNWCKLPCCRSPCFLGILQPVGFLVRICTDTSTTSIHTSFSIRLHHSIDVYPFLPVLIILPLSFKGIHMASWPQQGETVVPGCSKNTALDGCCGQREGR